MTSGFSPPAYPYDRLEPAKRKAASLEGGLVDLSIGTPCDPPPASVLSALADADRNGAVRGYPASIGSEALRSAARDWIARRFAVEVESEGLAVCVGTKEFVATLPQWLKLRRPDRDTVLYPAVSYPTYAMGATLAGLRAVAVPMDPRWRLDLAGVSEEDASRALVLWVNTPGNPTGGLDDLASVAAWGRTRGIPVFSDECYAEFTWDGPPRTVLSAGAGQPAGAGQLAGLVAVHSLSKRSNLAGMRVGIYAGDPELVGYLREVRKHVGMMVPGPVQLAAAAAFADQDHVESQRRRYRDRLAKMISVFANLGVEVSMPGGGFYLWVPVPAGAGGEWGLTEWLAAEGGVLVSPGELYRARAEVPHGSAESGCSVLRTAGANGSMGCGSDGEGFVRVAVVAPEERLELVAERLAKAQVPWQ